MASGSPTTPRTASARAQAVLARVGPAVLERFLALGGHALRTAGEATVRTVYRQAVRDEMDGLVAGLAHARGLPGRPSDTIAPTDTPDLVGVAHETLLGHLPRHDGAWRLASTHRRRSRGAYFTPPALVDQLVEAALAPLLPAGSTEDEVLQLRVVDPSVGAGAFLMAVVDRLVRAVDPQAASTALRRAVVDRCVCGVDIDPDAVHLTRQLLWLHVADPDWPLSRAARGVVIGDALLGPNPAEEPADLVGWAASHDLEPAEVFGWRAHFGPRPFDVVVGNPPWGRFRPQRRRFHLHLDPSTSNLQGQALRDHLATLDARIGEAWRAHAERRLAYGRALAACGTYRAQRVAVEGRLTGGDADAWKLFLERATQLVGDGGRVALVLPDALRRVEGATGLRRLLLDEGHIERLDSRDNRDGTFPIHAMFRYACLVWRRGASRPPHLRSLGPRRLLPHTRSAAEARLLAHLCRAGRGMEHLGAPRFVRELDMTRDRHRFLDMAALTNAGFVQDGNAWRHPERGVARPLVEGRMIQQHDPAAKAYRAGAGRRARWVALPWSRKRLAPHYHVVMGELPDAGAAQDAVRAAFCDITSHANERTALAALVPAGVPCGNKVPTVRFSDPDPRWPALWVAIANTFVVDWVLRRLVDTTLNFFFWDEVPFPPLPADGEVAEHLFRCAWRLACAAPGIAARGHLPATDPTERARLRAEIDARVATLYAIDRASLCVILDDFPLLDRHQPSLPGERRSTVTRDSVLLSFDAINGGTDPTTPARVHAARDRGAVAYVPGQLAAARRGS